MSRVSRIAIMLALMLSLALLGCERQKEDVLGQTESEETGEVVVENTPETEGEEEAAVAEEGAEEEPTATEATDGETTEEEPAEEEAVEPSTPEAETAEEESTAEASPEAEETTVAVGEQPEASPTPEEEGEDEEATASEEEAEVAEETEEEPATDSEASDTAGAGGTYAVKAGDTLFSVAQDHSTTVDQLRAVNNLTTNYIYVGQELQIPSGQTETAEAPSQAPSNQVHVVQQGEWLWAIARQYNTTAPAIKRANGLTSDIVYQGQRLTIPGQTAAPSNSGGAQTHRVGPGETLFSIASRYGTNVQAIKARNALNGDIIYVGQELVIP